jgi:hypothetical protein
VGLTHAQRIQRLVWASTGPEPIRKALEVHLIYLVEDGHDGLLNNLILQRRNAQWALSPIGGRVGNWRGGLTTPSPVPATSNGACGFPALRSPAHFGARVMRLRPVGPLSGLVV